MPHFLAATTRGALRVLASAAVLLAGSRVQASHLRAGEIVYERIAPFTVYKYRVHVYTYVKESSGVPDPFIELDWDDGNIDSIPLYATTALPDDSEKREYIAEHIYGGPGMFLLKMQLQYRNGGVLNVPGSQNVWFSVQSLLVISALATNNHSITFQNLPLQDACKNERWEHNSVAVDLDGDSLAYELRACTQFNQQPVVDYVFPDGINPGPNNDFSIDPITGTITWDAPDSVGEYNIAFVVREFRSGVLIGAVVRDMQIDVVRCINQPPSIAPLSDTCLTAGSSLVFNVDANDPNTSDNITLSALGEPFTLGTSPASFVAGFPDNPVSGVFSWLTDCEHVRLNPYMAVFRANDNDTPTELLDYQTMFITIVAPAPQNPLATPNGSVIELAWDPSICTNATGYRVYRRSGSYGFTPANCETGVPAYTGYQLISGSACISDNEYLDDDPGLVFGNEYCYMVVACFPDGAESYASVEFCAILNRQVPIITKVSVGATDVATGIDTVEWSNAYDLDTVQHPGPYQFQVYRGENFTTATTLAYTSTLWPYLAHWDTSFIDTGLDTETDPQVYRVELWGNDGATFIGSSNVASSLFLVPEPNDEQITLHFEHNTPWINSSYDVYRFNGVDWDFIGTSTTDSYVDTGLVNGDEYCYYAISTGAYSNPQIVSPLRNWSQEVCSVPVDLTPPCPPTLLIDNDCEEPLNTLTWTNPNSTCADDTWQYHIWFQDSLGGDFTLLATIIGAEDTTITHVNGSSVSGCYAVTAIDSVGNESDYSNIVCGDNCPEYTLPNVFTPNSDQSNEFFVPFPYRGVKRIDLQVFNRWGQLVFTTEDPAIGWNGLHQESNEPVVDGVYFYTCLVTFARLGGDELKQLTGYVHVLRGSGGNPN